MKGRRPIDLVGKTFGSWTVLSRAEGTYWNVRCACGRVGARDGGALRRGRSHSCGCEKGERISKKKLKYGPRKAIDIPEYKVWRGMINRCENELDDDFKNWGGRGIKVCTKWRNSFEAFYADVGHRPSNKHSIDRYPNNDGNYEPGNVRWATWAEQASNKRKPVRHLGPRPPPYASRAPSKIRDMEPEIVARLVAGELQTQIADSLGVSQAAISQVATKHGVGRGRSRVGRP